MRRGSVCGKSGQGVLPFGVTSGSPVQAMLESLRPGHPVHSGGVTLSLPGKNKEIAERVAEREADPYAGRGGY